MARYMLAIPTLPTSDMSATVAFYRDLLGFDVAVLWPDDEPTFCILIKDAVEVSFTAAPEGWLADRGVAMRLRVNDTLAIYEQVRDVVEVEWGPEVYDYGCREFSIKDCNGYSLIFSQETDETPTCLVVGGDG